MTLRSLYHGLRDHALLLSLLAIMAVFQWLTDGVLLQALNLTNLVLQNSYIVVMALGMLLVIVAGHIDLSVGSVCGFIGALAAVLMVQADWGVAPTVVVCLVCGGLIGAVQGWFVAYARIPSFIVTLAGMLIYKGLALLLLQGQSLGPFAQAFQNISTGFLSSAALLGLPLSTRELTLGLVGTLVLVQLGQVWQQRQRAQQHGMEVQAPLVFALQQLALAGLALALCERLASYKGLPHVLVLMAALAALYQFVAQRTTAGRRIYALGGNEKAARLSGIDTARWTLLAFANMGVLAALAGLVFAARLNSATPKAGLGFELDVIAACFIGGASASGGVGKVMGAVVGAFIMGVLNNGMSLLGIGIDYQQVIKGLVLLGAVFLDMHHRQRG